MTLLSAFLEKKVDSGHRKKNIGDANLSAKMNNSKFHIVPRSTFSTTSNWQSDQY